ncbi:ABC transporter permease [Streptomyces sp. NPDC005931]|uniref:ABC transporter permease n=1 Tax=Streptomyces sp. NPDC005931 TaxID=3364737 RepID=UPI0036BC061E
MRAMLRWVRADLRGHRGEVLFLFLATAGIIVSLLLAGALLSYAANPWQRIFTQSSGAHVWIQTKAGADPADLGRLDGVQSVSGPFRTAPATADLAGSAAAVQLRAADWPPQVARPLVTEGRWLAPGAEDEVVVESSLARALWAEPGDRLSVRRQDGTVQSLTISGLAEFAEPRYEPGETPGVAWVATSTFARLEPQERHEQVVGLRLADPDDTDFAIQRAVTELGADQISKIVTWQEARAEAQGGDRLLGLLLGVFGLGALLAAALAVAGAVSTRIRGSLRDISVLKAIGFTPAQLIQMFLAEYLAVALLAIVVGTLVTESLGARLPGRAGDAVQLWQALPGHVWVPTGIAGGAILLITATITAAAWRAGRVSPVPVARATVPAGRRMSGTARRALGLRLSPALVLGWRGAFQFPLRACAAVGRLTVPLLLITIALGTWTTLDRFEDSPEDVGIVAALDARGDGLDDTSVQRLLTEDPAVRGAYPGADVAALVPGQTGTIKLRGLGTAQDPYPFAVAEGRTPDGPDEAVAGQGLLDLLDVRVGNWVRMTVEGTPQVLHIVGRSIEPDDSGRVISTSLTTLREADPALGPEFYALVLKPGVAPSVAGDRIAQGADGRLDIRESTHPVSELSSVRPVIVGLIAVLALIGLAELSTTVAAGVRDRRRDLLALKAIGLTPRQIVAVIVAGTGFIALAAATVGTGLGVLLARWLIDRQGATSGIGSGIAQHPPATALGVLVAAAVVSAVAVSLLPALRAVRHRLADTLSDTL